MHVVSFGTCGDDGNPLNKKLVSYKNKFVFCSISVVCLKKHTFHFNLYLTITMNKIIIFIVS